VKFNEMPFFAVLMAGGGGTRLWPLSRKERPKQILPLVGGRSLFDLAVERLRGVLEPENIFVSASSELIRALQSSNAEVPESNYICEPSPRNTAPAIACALATLRTHAKTFVMACLPADHYIGNTQEFHSLFRAAGALAEKGTIVTIGIEPREPNIGYGYLEQGDSLGSVEEHSAFAVRRFKEKPTPDEAREMIAQGGHSWNSGMFFWRSDILEAEYRRQQPEMAEGMDRMTEACIKKEGLESVRSAWEGMPILSLDYAIMEHARSVAVLPSRNLEWTDIGTWDSLVDLYQSRPDLRPDYQDLHIDVGSKSLSVIRDSSSLRTLATVGLEDMIIVETDDAILICKKGKSQDVRAIAESVSKRKSKAS
jgi:mannose-1-phosphate guanylyltransferase